MVKISLKKYINYLMFKKLFNYEILQKYSFKLYIRYSTAL